MKPPKKDGPGDSGEPPDASDRYRPVTDGVAPSLLGAGGMAKVVAMYQTVLERVVAVKMPLADTPEARLLFEVEKLILAKLRHPSIVAIHDAGLLNGVPFYAMEYLVGRDLQQAMEMGEPALANYLPLFISVVKAVAFAHTQGIIHRDLKPANIYLGSQNEPKLIDFGLALDLNADPRRDPYDGFVVGSAGYMAPEVLYARYSRQSDIYALGVMLYQLAVGLLLPPATNPALFSQNGARLGRIPSSFFDRASGRLQPRPEMPSFEPRPPFPPDCKASAEVRAIIERATALLPEDRYPDAGAFVADLEALSLRAKVSARKYSWFDSALHYVRNKPGIVLPSLALTLVSGSAAVLVSGISIRLRAETKRADAETATSKAQAQQLELANESLKTSNANLEARDRELVKSKAEIAADLQVSETQAQVNHTLIDGMQTVLFQELKPIAGTQKVLEHIQMLVKEAKVAPAPHSVAESDATLVGDDGYLALRRGHWADGLEATTRCRARWEELDRAVPLSTASLVKLDRCILNQGDALEGLGRLEDSLAHMSEAHQLIQARGGRTLSPDLALADALVLSRLGAIQLELKRVDEADASMKACLSLVAPITTHRDRNIRQAATKRIAVADLYFGYVALARKDPKEARLHFEKALASDESRAPALKSEARIQSDLVEDLVGLALTDIAEGDDPAAIARLDRAEKLIEDLIRLDDDRVEWMQYGVKCESAYLQVGSLPREAVAAHREKLAALTTRIKSAAGGGP